ncbi:hypothetical protein [Paludisphaera sp.]|uniref:hypothetical protein n=1 Tax=Paludisphaera sp. TaxID=2017432 RepID=UPI00301CB09C
MKIRMLTILAGPGGCVDAGAEADVPLAMAIDLVSGGYAEALEPFPEPEPDPPSAPEPEPEPEPETEAPAAEKPSKRKAK